MARKNLVHLMIQDLIRVRDQIGRLPAKSEYFDHGKYPMEAIKTTFGGWLRFSQAAWGTEEKKEEQRDPKILIFDIETAPIIAYVWSTWQQDVGLNQIQTDWHLMAWAAKWLDKPEIFYADQRNAKPLENDKELLKGIWKLLNEADVVITQNGKAFDQKKLNARFIINKMNPPAPFQHIDTKQLAKKNFAFTSNRLEYMAEKLCTKKKSAHKKFPGFELWRECIKGNLAAWNELEEYNKADVLATEELYKLLAPWGNTGVDLNLYRGEAIFKCQCGSTNLKKSGWRYAKSGKFQRYECLDCGTWTSETGANRSHWTPKKKDSLKGF